MKILSVKKSKKSPLEELQLNYPNSWFLVQMTDQKWYLGDSITGYSEWKKMDKRRCNFFCSSCNTPEDLIEEFLMLDMTEEIIIENAVKVFMGDQ